MKLNYIKLHEYNEGFPESICGVFNDGWKQFPIILHEQGISILETTLPIVEADKICCEILHVKKLPSNVIVKCN